VQQDVIFRKNKPTFLLKRVIADNRAKSSYNVRSEDIIQDASLNEKSTREAIYELHGIIDKKKLRMPIH
jgi:hypothetical protein